MFTRLLCVLSLSLLSITPTAHAASPHDVAEVDQLIHDESIPAEVRAIDRWRQRRGGTTLVFVHEGVRYELYSTSRRVHPGMTDPFLSVTLLGDSREWLAIITDHKLDGTVDVGVSRKGVRTYESGRHDKRDPIGLEYADAYQADFDKVIAAALAYKRSQQKQ